MDPLLQKILAFALVGVATLWLIASSLRRRKSGGCGSAAGCGCGKVNKNLKTKGK